MPVAPAFGRPWLAEPGSGGGGRLGCLLGAELSPLPLAQTLREALASLPRSAIADEEELPSWKELAQEPCKKLQRVLSKRLECKNHTALLSSLDAEGRSRLRSCGGPLAAGWQLASPAFLSERLEDGEYRLTARALLGQDLAQVGRTCRRKRSTGDRVGQTCDAALCRQAHHAYRCAVGGGLKQRSIAVEDVYAGIHRECGFQVDRQVAVPAWDRFRWRCRGANCSEHGVLFAPPVGPCGACGSALDTAAADDDDDDDADDADDDGG